MIEVSTPRKVATVLLCGPSRESVSGVATHLNQIFGSELANDYKLVQFQVGSEGRNEGNLAKIFRLVTSPASLFQSIRRSKPEIIHLNSSLVAKAYWRDLVYLLVSKVTGCKVVYQVHGGALPSDFLGRSVFGESFLRWSLNLPDALVLLAEVEKRAYEQFQVGKYVVVIPNAVALDFDVQAKFYETSPFKLGYIGRLAHDKGVLETIKAMAILRDRGLDFLELHIAGSGPCENELKREVEELELSAVVKFLGPIFGEQKARFWHEIGLFLFPTFHDEGIPYTVLEALASGTPQITTKVGGIPDVIFHGVQGLLIDSHDPLTVANSISGLVIDSRRLEEMSAAAIARAREYYSVERLAQQFDQLYQRVIT